LPVCVPLSGGEIEKPETLSKGAAAAVGAVTRKSAIVTSPMRMNEATVRDRRSLS
jgi:hypothetical protein